MENWLIKSEPDVYSLANLKADKTELWDGVRNYQARNFLQQMRRGDRLFFYHSNTKPAGIVGLATVTQENLVDPSQFDSKSKYFDPKSPLEKPRWYTVEVGYKETFAKIITLDQLKAEFTPEEFAVVRRGNRLSVMPVAAEVAARILNIALKSEAQ